MINSMGQTGIHALITLAAIAAVQTAGRLSPAFFFGVPQFNFIEIALALANRQLGHLSPLRYGLIFRNGSIDRIFVDNRLAAFGHILAFDISQNRFGRLFAGANGADGHPGPGLQVAAGKHAVALGGIGDRVDFGRPPAGIRQPGNVFERREVRSLPDGRNQLVDFDLVFASGNRNGSLAPRRIGFAELHANTAQAHHPAVPG